MLFGKKAGNGGPAPAPEGKLLSVAEILAAEDVRSVRVHVPEWGGDVILSSLSSAAQERFIAGLMDENGQPRTPEFIKAFTIAMACRDAEGRLMFTPQEVPALAAKSSAVIDRLLKELRALDPLADRVEAAAQD